MRLIRFLKALPSNLVIALAPILRLLAAVLLLAAVIAFVASQTLHQGSMSTAQYWQQMAPASYANAGKAVSRVLGEWAWTSLLALPLSLPAYALFALLAVILGVLGRHRRRVQVFVN